MCGDRLISQLLGYHALTICVFREAFPIAVILHLLSCFKGKPTYISFQSFNPLERVSPPFLFISTISVVNRTHTSRLVYIDPIARAEF